MNRRERRSAERIKDEKSKLLRRIGRWYATSDDYRRMIDFYVSAGMAEQKAKLAAADTISEIGGTSSKSD